MRAIECRTSHSFIDNRMWRWHIFKDEQRRKEIGTHGRNAAERCQKSDDCCACSYILKNISIKIRAKEEIYGKSVSSLFLMSIRKLRFHWGKNSVFFLVHSFSTWRSYCDIWSRTHTQRGNPPKTSIIMSRVRETRTLEISEMCLQ